MITAKASSLYAAIGPAAKAAGGASGSAANYRVVRLQVENGILTVTGVNSAGYRLKTRSAVIAGDARFDTCIVPDRLLQILKSCGDSDVDVVAGGTGFHVTCGHSHWRLLDDEPTALQTVKTHLPDAVATLRGARLTNLMASASRFTGEGNERFAMNGVLIGVAADQSTLDFVATDSKSMIHLTRTAVVTILQADGLKTAVIPRKVCRLIAELPNSELVTIEIGKTVRFAVGDQTSGWEIETAVLEGRFPAWQNLLTGNRRSESRGTVDAKMFASCVRQAQIALDKENEGVLVKIEKGTIRFSANQAAFGESEAEMVCDSQLEPLSTLFSGGRLVAAMGAVSDAAQVSWRQNNSESVALFTSDSIELALMPLVS